MLLVWLFILGPGALPLLADSATDYIAILDRGVYNDSVINYEYDDNGSLTSKTTATDGNSETVTYTYNFQGRLETVTTVDAGGTSVVAYCYDTSDNRISKTVDGVATSYLVDNDNPTGYSQVLEERTDGSLSKSYTIGDDILAQTLSSGTTSYLLYDGHGSTRQLLTGSAVYAVYDYDSYGIGVQSDETAGYSDLQYTGEMKDSETSDYYLRARYYSPATGRFNRIDPYAGNTQDPQSLHKYLYCHANLVSYSDPSGMMTIAGMSVTAAIGSLITSISSLTMSAYVWAATNMALITAVTYYAMWSFVISSIWAASEDEGYLEPVTIGNFRVAKGIQVVSGFAYFLGLMVMANVPDLEENIKMVRRIQERTFGIRQQIGKSHDFGSTYSVGVAKNKAGEQVTIISTNDQYLSGRISLKSNEIGLYGAGYSSSKMHAEERIVDFCREQNWQLLGIGASRDVCREVCLPAIRTTAADIVTPIVPEKMVK